MLPSQNRTTVSTASSLNLQTKILLSPEICHSCPHRQLKEIGPRRRLLEQTTRVASEVNETDNCYKNFFRTSLRSLIGACNGNT